MTKQRTTTSSRLWSRTTQALGKWWAAVITLPDRPNQAEESGLPPTMRFPYF